MKTHPNIGERLGAMVLDHFIMTMVMTIVVLPSFAIQMFRTFSSVTNVSHEPQTLGLENAVYFYALGFAIYFCKDTFYARSPAKRILKLQVVDTKTDLPASPVKCVIRNLTIILWPVEVIMALINPQQRLGDRLAGTKIAYYEPVSDKPQINWKSVITALFIGLAFSSLIILSFKVFIDNLQYDRINYIESSFNQQATDEANQFFEEELGEWLAKIDFRAYDQIENDDRKYISAILIFSNWEDYDNIDQSEAKIKTLLYQHFQPDDHILYVKYVFKEQGFVGSQTRTYDSKND